MHKPFGLLARALQNADLGVHIEGLKVRDHALLAVQAVDYRYRIGHHFALSAFAGAAICAIDSPSYGWRLGGGAQWRDLFPGWGLNLDYFPGIELARERTLACDPPPPNPPSVPRRFTARAACVSVCRGNSDMTQAMRRP